MNDLRSESRLQTRRVFSPYVGLTIPVSGAKGQTMTLNLFCP